MLKEMKCVAFKTMSVRECHKPLQFEILSCAVLSLPLISIQVRLFSGTKVLGCGCRWPSSNDHCMSRYLIKIQNLT